MTREMLRRIGLAGLLVLVWAGVACAGWKLVEKQEDETSIAYVDGDRMVSLQEGKFRTVMTPDQRLMISDRHRTYYEASLAQFKKEMCQMMKDAYAQMNYRPPKTPDPKVRVEKIGPSKMAGYQVEGYRVIADGTPYREIWVNRDSRLESLDTAWKTLADERPGTAWACGLPPGRDEKIESDPAYREIVSSGFVFYEKSLDSAVYHPETVSVEKIQVPAEKFELPRGYRKLTLKEFFQQAQQEESQSEPPRGYGQMMHPEAEEEAAHGADAGSVEPSAVEGQRQGYGSDTMDTPQREEERARWGGQPRQEEEPAGVKEQLKEGVKGLLKSLFN